MPCVSDTPFDYVHSSLKYFEDDYLRFTKNKSSIKYMPREMLESTFTLIDDVKNHLEYLRNCVDTELKRRNGAINEKV